MAAVGLGIRFSNCISGIKRHKSCVDFLLAARLKFQSYSLGPPAVLCWEPGSREQLRVRLIHLPEINVSPATVAFHI
jgi:hypothetical protein